MYDIENFENQFIFNSVLTTKWKCLICLPCGLYTRVPERHFLSQSDESRHPSQQKRVDMGVWDAKRTLLLLLIDHRTAFLFELVCPKS